MINIGVTGTGSLIGQAIIKCIKGSKFSEKSNLVGFDYFSKTVGSYWRNTNYVLTDIYKSPEKQEFWLKEIEEIIENEKLQFLFIGVDFELPLFAKYKNELEKKSNIKILVSSTEVIEIGNDKYKTANFLKMNGLYYPETILFKDCIPSEITYPVILKPAVGARSRGVYVVKNSLDLIEKATTIDMPVVQELVGNDDTEYTCGVLMLDDNFISSIILRRTLKEGNTSKAYYKKDYPEIILSYIKQITEKLKPYGSCNLQLRIDNKGIPKLFEINARHSGTTYMRSHFGYNEVEIILDYFLTGTFVNPITREGVAIRYYDEMFQDN